MQSWNLILSIQMLLGASIASFLLVGKHGFKQVRLYVVFAIILSIKATLFQAVVPAFIFLLVAFKNGKITPPLFWINTLLGIIAIKTLIGLIWISPNFMFTNNVTACSILLVAGTLCMHKYRDYSLAFTLTTFTFFWTAYGNSWHPVNANVSMPFACLSLLIFLYLHVVSTKFKGSVVHIMYKYLTRRRFKRYHREKRVIAD